MKTEKLSSTRKLLIACLLATSLLVLNAQAQPVSIWNPAGNGITTGYDLWSDGNSWSPAGMPTASDVVELNNNNAVPCVIDASAGTATCNRLNIGDPLVANAANGSTGTLIITNGGVFAPASGYCAIGYNGTNCLLDVEAGCSATFPSHLWIGFDAGGAGGCTGTLIMNGGTVTVMGMTGLGWNPGGIGTAHINGGTLNCMAFHPTQSIGPGSLIDVAGGTINITGNFVTAINNYAAASPSRITAYGGTGVLSVIYSGGLTVITATGGSTPPPPPRQSITSITYSGGTVTITFNTTVGASYHIASTSSLLPPVSWTAVPGSQTNSVTGTSVSYSFTPGSAPQFYETVSP